MVSFFRFRRCKNCNVKTHKRFWEEGLCPVCHEGVGWGESSHGLRKAEIGPTEAIFRAAERASAKGHERID